MFGSMPGADGMGLNRQTHNFSPNQFDRSLGGMGSLNNPGYGSGNQFNPGLQFGPSDYQGAGYGGGANVGQPTGFQNY